MEKWRCSLCSYVHEGNMPDGFRCPVCSKPGSQFVKIEEVPEKQNNKGNTKQ